VVTHCLNSSTLLGSEEKKHKLTRICVLQSQEWRAFMKSHLSSNCRRRGTKKLSSLRFTSWRVLTLTKKNKVEIHKDSGLYGIGFTVNKRIPDFYKAAEKVDLDYAHAFIKFENALEGMLNSAWKYVLKENFPKPIGDSAGDLSPESNWNLMESFQRAIELFL
jgi:AICAR transformylase/IMP cyclohydrolase PurH